MSDKSPTGVGPVFALPGHTVISLQGRDAMAFAQAQFMNDVAALADGQWQWSGWLTPKGRVIALFALVRIDAQTLWLLLADGGAAAIAERLRGFLFRSKVSIGLRGDLVAGGRFAAPLEARANVLAAAQHGDGVIELDLGGLHSPRTVLMGPGSAFSVDNDALARWRVQDLIHGLPRLLDEQCEQWTPQQLSLERLRAFSVKKGCYPGQEIVARTHFLGKAKRGLALLESMTPIAVGADVLAAGTSLGRVMASADAGATHVALAVLPLERADAALNVDGALVTETAWREGLAR